MHGSLLWPADAGTAPPHGAPVPGSGGRPGLAGAHPKGQEQRRDQWGGRLQKMSLHFLRITTRAQGFALFRTGACAGAGWLACAPCRAVPPPPLPPARRAAPPILGSGSLPLAEASSAAGAVRSVAITVRQPTGVHAARRHAAQRLPPRWAARRAAPPILGGGSLPLVEASSAAGAACSVAITVRQATGVHAARRHAAHRLPPRWAARRAAPPIVGGGSLPQRKAEHQVGRSRSILNTATLLRGMRELNVPQVCDADCLRPLLPSPTIPGNISARGHIFTLEITCQLAEQRT